MTLYWRLNEFTSNLKHYIIIKWQFYIHLTKVKTVVWWSLPSKLKLNYLLKKKKTNKYMIRKYDKLTFDIIKKKNL